MTAKNVFSQLLVSALMACLLYPPALTAQQKVQVQQWTPLELTYRSDTIYANPLYDATLEAIFEGPSGKRHRVAGFWDGGDTWKIRFTPDEVGTWQYRTRSADTANRGLHQQEGKFRSRKNPSSLEIYSHGKVGHGAGDYQLSHADGTPFFYLGCTAWNGALRATALEWATYLRHRREHHYSVIQFVCTQWRGLPAEAMEVAAYTGDDPLSINPAFFQTLDKKIEQINAAGLVAAPVMLWVYGAGPGSDLPVASAIQLAKYIKARYDAYHVIWNLGGDGVFTGDQEAKWKAIGREVFGDSSANQSPVTLHAGGYHWYGHDYDGEPWLDMISYQTGHTNAENHVRWKTRGPVANGWHQLKPRPIIDTEPVYENQGERANDHEVRKSVFWSLFSAPVAGVSYGAWSTWPWLRVGEMSYNHGMKDPSPFDWEDGIKSRASIQLGRLPAFFGRFNWWELRPVRDAVRSQSGGDSISSTISVLADGRGDLTLVYVPVAQTFVLAYEQPESIQEAAWFLPATGAYVPADLSPGQQAVEVTSPSDSDAILVLSKSALPPVQKR
ncbi:MAG TPA: DUF4038 domain-containing protein [Burkholderiaceae bacterium]|nr:DUF4038 domain-containing protein [Burkholderiaceae bacterium]